MEHLDAISTFAAGLALGLVIGHWLRKQTLRLEYERGRMDGINELWPHLVSSWLGDLLARRRKPAGNAAPGGDGSAG